MRTFRKDERLPSRAARDRGDAPPLLSVEEQLEGVSLELIQPVEVNGTNADSDCHHHPHSGGHPCGAEIAAG